MWFRFSSHDAPRCREKRGGSSPEGRGKKESPIDPKRNEGAEERRVRRAAETGRKSAQEEVVVGRNAGRSSQTTKKEKEDQSRRHAGMAMSKRMGPKK